MAKSYLKSEFHMLMEKVEAVDARVKNYLKLTARELPIYDFLEEVRLMFGRWNCENRQQALYTFTDLIGKFQEILQQNEAVYTYEVFYNKNFKKGPYCSDLYKPKTVLRTYDLPIYPLPHKDDWVIPKEIMDKIVLPPKYK
ncbi:uncharacterized protein LOC124889654 [Capsicum annuum]|uniref:uncharacterized protein LOC124889654 n=1 Tax=Capsicum annuum TaxID=4072 RepID=UPI001FB162BD|nr:uncharacterized protein LOC124889654 [Capsicum annuum]